MEIAFFLQQKLLVYLSQISADIAEPLEISVYTTEDIANFRFQQGRIIGAEQWSFTKINSNGDAQIHLPCKTDHDIDEKLWNIHLQTVELAQNNRATISELVLSANSQLRISSSEHHDSNS